MGGVSVRKLLVLFTVLTVLLAVVASAYTLTILETTDLHGHVYPVDYSNNADANYGLARLATLIKQIKAQQPNVLLFDNGDLIQGSPLEYYHAVVDNNGIDPMINVMNYLGYSAMALGNHEFNYGQSVLRKVISEADFPITSANIVKAGTSSPVYGDGYVLFNMKDGPKVGYIALTTQYIPNWEEPRHIQGISFLDAVKTAGKYVKTLQYLGADVIIVGYHGGLERDLKTGQPTEDLTGENEGYAIATEVKGISALLLGHQHNSVATELDGVPIVMASSWGRALGRIDLELAKENDQWVVKSSKAQLLSANDVAPDPKVLAMDQKYEDATQKWLDQPLGEATGDFSITDPMQARMHDNALIQFVNTVQMFYSKAPISSTALFSDSVRGWKKGPITMRDVISTYVYPNTLKVLDVSGQDIKDAIERSASYFTFDGGKVGTSGLPGYNYDIYEGISYVIDLTKPVGQRVVWLAYEGKPMAMSGTYELVLNNYRAGGGGNYAMFKGKPVVREVMMEVSELMADYVRTNKTVSPSVNDNWQVITRPFDQMFRMYTVASGDTLDSIASKFNTTSHILMGLNAMKSAGLTAGQVILVPNS